MDRRQFLQKLPVAVAAGAYLQSDAALAADPAYYTQNGGGAVVVSSSQVSPGPNWSLRTLQGAIDLAISANKPLNILPGRYYSRPLVITSTIEIYGSPGEVSIASSTGSAFNLDIRPPNSTSKISHVTIRGISFWGNYLPFASGVNTSERLVDPFLAALGPFNALVTAYRVLSLIIEECDFGASSSGGLAIWECRNAAIRTNEIYANSVAFYAHNSTESMILNNYVHDHKNYGIFITQWPAGPNYSILRGNRVLRTSASFGAGSGQVAGSGQYGNAILAFYAHNLNINGNRCVTSAYSGIRANGCSNCIIANNQVINAGGTAVMFECPGGSPLGPTNPLRFEGGIIVNNVINNAGRGIAVTNSYWGGRRAVIDGNHIKQVYIKTLNTTDPLFPSVITTGVGINAEADTLVSSNIVEDTQGPGILCMAGAIANSTMKTTCSCTGNTVKNAPIGVAFFKDSPLGYTLIQGNMITGFSQASIASVYNSCENGNCTYPRTDNVDYGALSGGLYNGKPYPNVMIGGNFRL